MKRSILKALRRKFALVEPGQPELYREQFPYTEIPRTLFDGTFVAPDASEDIWITDTTFRDGQQARPPYAPQQIVDLYTLLHRLGGPKGVVRQCEYFLYSKRDREALEGCLALGYEYPEVTGWIRANIQDLSLVKAFGLRETGILTSASDYHIFLKLKKKRAKALEDYLAIVKEALSLGVRPRCHFEDVTRADVYGFCLPFAEQLLVLSQDSGVPVKVRLCDTLGFGLPFPNAVLPRSIPKLVHAFIRELGYPGELLEWHGHNDFHKVHANGLTAWLYGVSALNTTLLGFGERTGNPPLEAAVVEYAGIKGSTDGIDLRVITEIAEYFHKEVHAAIPSNFPFVGSDFNTTRAGIHADGIIKNQEVYNIFDTGALLNRPLRVTVTDKSGMAGITEWINKNIPQVTGFAMEPLSKRHPGVRHIHQWVVQQYEQGRTTSISPDELVAQARHYLPSLFVSDFERIRRAAMVNARQLAEEISDSPEVHHLDGQKMEHFLRGVVRKEHSIQLLAITNTDGYRISQVHTQRGEKALFRNLMSKDFKKHEWFLRVVNTGEPYYSDLFFSKYTGRLIMTAALPIYSDENRGSAHSGRELSAIIDIDFVFDELAKLITDIPEEILETHPDQ